MVLNFLVVYSFHHYQTIAFQYTVVDVDIGELFSNFPIHDMLKKVVRIELYSFKEELGESFSHIYSCKPLVTRWKILCFGWNQNPELATTFYYWAEEFIRRKHADHHNPLRWEKVVLNLMCSPRFNSALPNVYKWDDLAKRIAGDMVAFVDDLRAIDYSLDQAWRIARWMTSKLELLGVQNAPINRRIDNGP